jgi:UDP-N-acetylmuramate dehydrogenase
MFLKTLQTYADLKIYHDQNLSSFFTMKISYQGTLVEVFTEETLAKIFSLCDSYDIWPKIMGLGSNVVPTSHEMSFYLRYNPPYQKEQLQELKEEYRLPSSVPIGLLTQTAIRLGLKGWEALTGIPASLGGAVWMNAGTRFGDIGSLVKNVRYMKKNGVIHTVETRPTEKFFEYRRNLFLEDGDLILDVTLIYFGIEPSLGDVIRQYLLKRKNEQPLDKPTCGCVFKNPSMDYSAGRLIDLLGLKGWEFEGFMISHRHGNFIENRENGSSENFLKFVKMIQYELELQYGRCFELEVMLL